MLWRIGIYRRWLRADPKRLGRWGERYAGRYLRRLGFKILTRNWKCRAGEIDLIAVDNAGPVVFVEIKTRRDEVWAPAQDAVSYGKQHNMSKVARQFVKKYKLDNRPLRFDVIAVVLREKGAVELRRYENAFRVTF